SRARASRRASWRGRSRRSAPRCSPCRRSASCRSPTSPRCAPPSPTRLPMTGSCSQARTPSTWYAIGWSSGGSPRATWHGWLRPARRLGGTIDVVTRTSSATVRGFVDLVGRAAATSGRFSAAVIGPVTAASARELGLPVVIEAEDYTVGGLVAALVRYYAEGGTGGET